MRSFRAPRPPRSRSSKPPRNRSAPRSTRRPKRRRSNSKSRADIGLRRSALAVGAGVGVGVLAVVPIPYFVIAPGHAIDLRARIAVEGRPASESHYLLTDVSIARATPLETLARFLPAREIVPIAAVMPEGESPQAFDRSMTDAMIESQNVASYVAERAAGIAVREDFIVRIGGFAPNAPSQRVLRAGDRLVAVAGEAVHGTSDIARAIASHASRATTVAVTIERDGKRRTVAVPEMSLGHGARRLGVFVDARLPSPALPVPVRFSMDDVSGASGGLMFALQIYADVRGARDARIVAGTGTLAPDGTVGPIEGGRQKLEAARRAGATIFFVPKANAADVPTVGDRSIAIVPVATFADALAYLKRSSGD